MTEPILQVDALELRFGGVRALDGLSFTVDHNQLCAIVGPNGAGKSSLFNCISGLYRPQKGRIQIDGEDVLSLRPSKIAALGVGRTFQNLALFPKLTVLENVLVGGYLRHRSGVLGCVSHAPGERHRERLLRNEAMDVLEQLELDRYANDLASGLSFGILKRVELARSLVTRPKLLLLDEPAAGLSHGHVAEFGQYIAHARTQFNVAIVLVEHHMGLVMSISEKVIVLNLGKRISQGTPAEVSKDPVVIDAYLGGEAA